MDEFCLEVLKNKIVPFNVASKILMKYQNSLLENVGGCLAVKKIGGNVRNMENLSLLGKRA